MTRTLALALLLAPALALAEPKTPDDWYTEGSKQFDLGKFDTAIEAFKKGFELETNASKRPAYLFNVALAYREQKNCKDAVFFFKRFLALKDEDKVKPLTAKKRAEVDKYLADLDDCAKEQEAAARKPEPVVVPPKPVVVAVVTPEPKEPQVEKPAPGPAPHVISIRAIGGGAKIKTGGLEVPIQASFGLIAGYPFALGDKLTLDLGGAFLFQPVPFATTMTPNGSAQMISALADLGATYQVAPRVAVRGDLGLGALVFSGVSESPFTDGKPTTGALTMLEARVGVSVDIAITPNLLAIIAPLAFSYSPPKDGLRSDIKSITRLDFMIGVGYRM